MLFLKVIIVDRQMLLYPFAEHHRMKATGNPFAPINGNPSYIRGQLGRKTNAGGYDIFVVKYDAYGNLE